MVESVLHFLFYLSSALCAFTCIRIASVMNEATRQCMKNCLRLVTIGLVIFVMLVFYEIRGWPRLVASLPIIWGITGWLFFDHRYKENNDLLSLLEWFRGLSNDRHEV